MNIKYESYPAQIDTKNIIIDNLGQRDVEQRGAQFRKIMREFDPNLVQPISLALIDGKYYCFDGQMTMKVLKAKNGGKDLKVDCRVYKGMTLHEAAQLFIKQRGSEVKPSLADKIRVNANYGDPESVQFVRAVEFNGFRIDRNPGADTGLVYIGATVQLWKEYKAFDNINDFNDFLHVLRYGFYRDKYGTNNKIVGGLGYFMRAYGKDEYKLDELIKALGKRGALNIIQEGDRHKSMGMRKYALEILDAYNTRSPRCRKLPEKL